MLSAYVWNRHVVCGDQVVTIRLLPSSGMKKHFAVVVDDCDVKIRRASPAANGENHVVDASSDL